MNEQSIQINHPEFVYHGTVMRYLSGFTRELVDSQYWRMDRDFGRGFYTTVDLDQAKGWAVHRASQSLDEQPCVLQIRCELLVNLSRVRQHVFLGESRQWSDYVLIHRLCEQNEPTDPCLAEGLIHADIVTGPMADNDTGGIINEYRVESHGKDWFYQNITLSASGDVRQGLGLGNQIVYCDENFARELLHLHSYWVYDENRGWQHVDIGQQGTI